MLSLQCKGTDFCLQIQMNGENSLRLFFLPPCLEVLLLRCVPYFEVTFVALSVASYFVSCFLNSVGDNPNALRQYLPKKERLGKPR